MTNNGNMPAMPKGLCVENGEFYGNDDEELGLTKREQFAAMAMQGLLSNSNMGDSNLWPTPQEWVKQMTETGVEMADALLSQLEKAK